jgi:hypothetical protein
VIATFTGSGDTPSAHAIKNLNNATIIIDSPQRVIRLTPLDSTADIAGSSAAMGFPLQTSQSATLSRPFVSIEFTLSVCDHA